MLISPKIALALASVAVCLVCPARGSAQTGQAAPPGQQGQQGQLVISLESALSRVRTENPAYLAASLDAAIATEDRVQARAAQLPSASFLNQFIYTRGNGTEHGVFIGADGVHVYNAQGVVHAELFSPELRAEYRRALAGEAVAKAQQDVALKGIASSVVENYYTLVFAVRKLAAVQQAFTDAKSFVQTTEKLERGGEVAHADTVKAQILLTQRRRDVEESAFAIDKAHIALAVLIFPNPTQDFSVVDDLEMLPPIPPFEEVSRLARSASPEIRAANSSLLQEQASVAAARSARLPSVSFDYFFGINSNRFATSIDGVRNLGSQAQATLNIPIFNGALKSRVTQADLRRRQAGYEAELVEKELAAHVATLHKEAVSARSQIDSLKSIVDLASESLRLTLLRYQAGEVSVLEVVDAQTTLFEARQTYDEALARYRAVWATIQIVTGNF